MNKKGILIILSGFSGVGKEPLSDVFFPITIITHFPFPQQHENHVKEKKTGCRIFFKSKEEFEQMIKEDSFYRTCQIC